MNYNTFDLHHKVALLTGGNGGVGLGFARELAKAGADVCIWGRDKRKNLKALEELQAYNQRAAAFVCDITSEEEVKKCMDKTLNEFGHIDGCFANAGVFTANRSFLKISCHDIQNIIDVNLKGSFYTLKYAAEHMIKRAENNAAGGRLVAVSSIAAMYGAAGAEHYTATKSALIPMIKGLAVEFGRYGITANIIMPGWIETSMTKKIFSSERFCKAVKSRIPLRRWGKPEDLGAIAVYIMSDASAYHTGDSFIIDGAYSIF